MKDTSGMKPKKFQDHLTITEVERAVDWDKSWLRKLEKRGEIPKAARVKVGKLHIRLWSPKQVEEIKVIKSKAYYGRRRDANG